jgi:hypothetical protein
MTPRCQIISGYRHSPQGMGYRLVSSGIGQHWDSPQMGRVLFVMTDNTLFKGAYYKGHSPSEKLNDIVFRLHKAVRDGGFILHVLHISGKRMKATGVDGLSRGDLTEGMLAGG